MAMNASGAISLGGATAGQSINLENGQSATATVSLNDSAVRSLAGVPSGAIVMPTNFYGKSNQFIPPAGFYSGSYTVFHRGDGKYGVILNGSGTFSFSGSPAVVSEYLVIDGGGGGGASDEVGGVSTGGGGGKSANDDSDSDAAADAVDTDDTDV